MRAQIGASVAGVVLFLVGVGLYDPRLSLIVAGVALSAAGLLRDFEAGDR